jgi:radical SAM enzyme (TIGR01210 family)
MPEGSAARTAWIEALRPDLHRQREALPVDRPGGWLWETEPDGAGGLRPALTIFLTNRECPWRCLMCDLWRHTRTESVPAGAIPRQIDVALKAAGAIPPGTRLKLYNAGSFFDAGAIPPADHVAIAALCGAFESVLVECHPTLVGDGRRIREFQALLSPARLEVAMGLETAHPEVLERLNKRMTLDDFQRAAGVLRSMEVGTRTFVLVAPPFLPREQVVEWTGRSVDFAFSTGIECVAVIPTRSGNGALERLHAEGWFEEPTLDLFEDAVDAAMVLRRGMLLADLWDLERFGGGCPRFEARRGRLEAMNQQQRVLPRVAG